MTSRIRARPSTINRPVFLPRLPVPNTRIRYSSTASPRGPNIGLNAGIAAVLLGLAGYTFYRDTSSSTGTASKPSSKSDNAGRPFEVTTGSGRNRTVHNFTRLSHAEVETKLTEHEDTQSISRPGNPVVRWDRNWVGSNEPCEDRSAIDLIPRQRSARDMPSSWLGRLLAGTSPVIADTGDSGSKDIMLFSIMDGHAGFATSELLSKVLHPTMTISLAGLQAGVIDPMSAASGFRGMVDKWNPLKWVAAGEQWTTGNVMKTISATYTSLDHNICQTPVRLIPALKKDTQGPAGSEGPSSSSRALLAALAEPADNGACCISAVVDAEEGDLYVALAGDCRAVAGWEKDGVWRCDVLSEDQMGENDNEIARMRKEHPGEEDTVIMRGRVMGGLQPTRAFGDASYKWQHNETAEICAALKAEGKKARGYRPSSRTPPYVTAEPVIEHRRIKGKDGEKLRFVVLATDGLWDRITSEEATLLLASYLAHPTHPEIHKSHLPTKFPLAPYPSSHARPYPSQTLPGTGDRAGGTWVFEGDKNAATHLIRNSLAGGQRDEMVKLLSMTGGVTRWFRDDVTVTVVFFDDK